MTPASFFARFQRVAEIVTQEADAASFATRGGTIVTEAILYKNMSCLRTQHRRGLRARKQTAL